MKFYTCTGLPGPDAIFPRIDYITPSTAQATGGSIIDIYGEWISANVTGVTIGGQSIASTDFTVVSDMRITVTNTPVLAVNQHDVVVQTSNGNATATKALATQSVTAPSAPALSGIAYGLNVALSWSLAGGADYYEVEQDGEVVVSNIVGLDITLPMEDAVTDYSFRVRGVSIITGNGAWSSAKTIKTDGVVDSETIRLAGTATVNSSDISGAYTIGNGLDGATISDVAFFGSAISLETFQYYVRDVLHNSGRNVLV